MRTDDFFADLELQLREAQPAPRTRRAWRIAAPAVALAAAVVAVIVIAGGGSDPREQGAPVTAPEGKVRVVIVNATGYKGADAALRDTVEGLHFRLAGATRDAQAQAHSEIRAPHGHKRDAEHLASAFSLPASVLTAGYAPLGDGTPAITVTLGRDFLGGGSGKGLDRVEILEVGGRPRVGLELERLFNRTGINIVGSGSGGVTGRERQTLVLARDSSDRTLLARTRRVMGLPPAAPNYATKGQRRYMQGARVLVLVGSDYRLPASYTPSRYVSPDG